MFIIIQSYKFFSLCFLLFFLKNRKFYLTFPFTKPSNYAIIRNFTNEFQITIGFKCEKLEYFQTERTYKIHQFQKTSGPSFVFKLNYYFSFSIASFACSFNHLNEFKSDLT